MNNLTGVIKEVYTALRTRDNELSVKLQKMETELAGLRAAISCAEFKSGTGLTAEQVCNRIQEALSCFTGNPLVPVIETPELALGDTSFEILQTPFPNTDILVFRNGVLQRNDALCDYTITGNEIALNYPIGISGNAQNEEHITVVYFVQI